MAISQCNNDAAKVAHIARIIASHQVLAQSGIEIRIFVRWSRYPPEVLGERQNVLAACTQRRQMQGAIGDSVIQVGAKSSVVYLVLQITVGRTDQPEISLLPDIAANALEAAFLDYAQQLCLQ